MKKEKTYRVTYWELNQVWVQRTVDVVSKTKPTKII